LRIDRARLDLERTEITAPIDAMVVKDFVEEESFVAKGTVVATLEDVSKVEVRCHLRMDEMVWIWRQPTEATDSSDYYRVPRTPVKVIYELAGRAISWEGILARYDGIGVDETTRTVPCRVVIDNPRSGISGNVDQKRVRSGPPALVRGMYVTLEIETMPEDVLLQVPEIALKPNGTLWVVRDGELRIRPIDVVAVRFETVIFAQNGDSEGKLRPGDRVVLSPVPGAYDGMPVQERSFGDARDTEGENGRRSEWERPAGTPGVEAASLGTSETVVANRRSSKPVAAKREPR